MANWFEFAQAQPAMAEAGLAQLFQHGVGLAFLATVRKDGGPRLHPVCPVLSNSRLYLFLLPQSPKRWDLERDGRFALQAFPQPRPDSSEFYISGTAQRVEDPDIYAAVFSDAKHSASRDEVLFELSIDGAMLTQWEGFGTSSFRSSHQKWAAPAPRA
jgi:hypothetical protein